MRSSALLNSYIIYALGDNYLTLDKKFVIESAILIKLCFRAILPASVNLSWTTFANLFVEVAISFPGNIEGLIELITLINSFSICASYIKPDFISCKVNSIFQPLASDYGWVSLSFLVAAPRLENSLLKWILNLNRWSKKDDSFYFAFSHNYSNTFKASYFLSQSYKH